MEPLPTASMHGQLGSYLVSSNSRSFQEVSAQGEGLSQEAAGTSLDIDFIIPVSTALQGSTIASKGFCRGARAFQGLLLDYLETSLLGRRLGL